MATFYDNLRASRSTLQTPSRQLPTRGDMQKERRSSVQTTSQATQNSSGAKTTGPVTWDEERINNVLDDRWAGLHQSETPMISLNVDIPKTQSVRNIQTGKYKLDNDTNVTGLNNDNALYIVGNTYQDNNDGTHYGMGWDGRPYSYTIKNDVVGNFTPLGIDEQKKAINRVSNGKIEIHETITNPATLAEIYRSIKRMNDYGNGNLIPDHVVVGDPDPGSVVVFGGSGLMGTARHNEGTKENPDHIELLGSDFPSIQAEKSTKGYNTGWSSTGGGDSVPQHELSHTAEFALLDSPYRYYDKVSSDSVKYKNQYSASDLWKDAINNIKYAIPLLSDAVFGTHFKPSKEEVEAMLDSENDNIVGVAEFWDDYYTPLEEKYDTVEQKMNREASRKTREWFNKYETKRHDAQYVLFEKAAKNTGFDSIEDALASVSTYATRNASEAFAEAYTDVLINGNRAADFSKELIRLYSEVADDTAKMFGKSKPTELKVFDNLLNAIPDFQTDKSENTKFQNNFINNFRQVSNK